MYNNFNNCSKSSSNLNLIKVHVCSVCTVCLCVQNPSKPHFNHYLFESLCLSIRITCKANPVTVSSFEEALFPVFTEILQNDVQGA